ncbi:MAG: hypothetical protein ACRDGQ_03320, partial [Candidatus Limnocylindrales bacterium]
AASDSGVTTVASSLYQAEPAQGYVAVTITEKITNHIPSTKSSYACVQYYNDPYYGLLPYETTCTETTTYYVNSGWLFIERGVSRLKVTANGQAVTLSKGEVTANYVLYKVTFPKTYYGQTRTILATYRIPGGAPRSASDVRLNAGYLNFFAVAQDADQASVRVEVPADFASFVSGASMTSSLVGKTRVYTSGSVDPDTFFVDVGGTNLAAFSSAEVPAENGREITVQGWPGDGAWMTAVLAEAQTSIARIEALIGQPLPGSGPIIVREAASGELGDSYIGDYDPAVQIAQVSEDYTQAGTVTHELSHAWFNDSLFASTWLSEGYAQWMERAAGANPVACVAPTTFPGTGQPDLATWQYAGPRATAAQFALVTYEYDASCAVVSQVAAAIGLDRMKAVIGVLATAAGAYPGVPDPGAAAPATWRDWLDAVDERGMVPAGLDDTHTTADLLVKYGIATTAELAGRAAARTALDQVRVDEHGASLPLAVSQPMASWTFAAADQAISATEATLRTLGQATTVLAGTQDAIASIRHDLADATDQAELDHARDEAAAELGVAQKVAQARSNATSATAPLAQLGLFGTNLPAMTVKATDALDRLDLPGASAEARSIDDLVSGAQTLGLIRLLTILTVVGLALLVMGLYWLRRRRYRKVSVAFVWAEIAAAGPPSPAEPAIDQAPAPSLDRPAPLELPSGTEGEI